MTTINYVTVLPVIQVGLIGPPTKYFTKLNHYLARVRSPGKKINLAEISDSTRRCLAQVLSTSVRFNYDVVTTLCHKKAEMF